MFPPLVMVSYICYMSFLDFYINVTFLNPNLPKYIFLYKLTVSNKLKHKAS